MDIALFRLMTAGGMAASQQQQQQQQQCRITMLNRPAVPAVHAPLAITDAPRPAIQDAPPSINGGSPPIGVSEVATKKKKKKRAKKQLHSEEATAPTPSVDSVADAILGGLSKRSACRDAKTEKSAKRKADDEPDGIEKKPAASSKTEFAKHKANGDGVMKRPAASPKTAFVLGCSKCRYLVNGCGACRLKALQNL